MGTCQRPGEKDKVKEPEQAQTDFHLPEDVLSSTLHVRDYNARRANSVYDTEGGPLPHLILITCTNVVCEN